MTNPFAALIGLDMEDVARAIYDAMRFERRDKTPDWVKGGNSNAQVEARATAARILAALEAAPVPDLADPVTVHANMLRGTIAKPTVAQIIHLYGREAFQPMIDAAVAKTLDDACLAVSEHADWPEDEHGRTEQVGLFARVINAIRAVAPAQVNETPKSEHDAGDVLSALPADVAGVVEEAGKVLEGVTPGPWSVPGRPDKICAEGYTTNGFAKTVATISDASWMGGEEMAANARFIAWCREGVPALISLATAQAAQIAGLEATVAEVTSDRAYIIGANAGWEAAVEQGEATPAAAAMLAQLEAAEAKVAELTKERDEARGGITEPHDPGGFVGDIYYGHPEYTTMGTHRWTGSEWAKLPSDTEALMSLLASARTALAAERAEAERLRGAFRLIELLGYREGEDFGWINAHMRGVATSILSGQSIDHYWRLFPNHRPALSDAEARDG